MALRVFKSKAEIEDQISMLKRQGIKIGFVPTMGALHKGHEALIEKSAVENDIAICSIFVNPTQFNDKKDFGNYPRNLQNDIAILDKTRCSFLFAPDETEMYEPGAKILNIDLNGLDKVMEGFHRPGHFAGVVTVVDRLFKIINPHSAYFGEKDFQQLAIIRLMASKLHPAINIVGLPTIREPDGLALSSRNQRLSNEERKNAPVIFKSMNDARASKNKITVSEIKSGVISNIESFPVFKVEYIEIADAETLKSVYDISESKNLRIFIAVQTSSVRLIDNIEF